MNPNSWLLDYPTVKASGGTDYIEIMCGVYADTCWNKDSLYLESALWQDCFDALFCECAPDYDFFEFTAIEPATIGTLAERLETVAELLEKTSSPQDLTRPPLLADTAFRQPYIRIGHSIEAQVFERTEAEQNLLAQHLR